MTSRDEITNEDIQTLWTRAESTEDAELMALCEAALEGDSTSAEVCINYLME